MTFMHFLVPAIGGIPCPKATVKSKPHVKLIGGIWYCAGAGRIAEGFTQRAAYLSWEAM